MHLTRAVFIVILSRLGVNIKKGCIFHLVRRVMHLPYASPWRRTRVDPPSPRHRVAARLAPETFSLLPCKVTTEVVITLLTDRIPLCVSGLMLAVLSGHTPFTFPVVFAHRAARSTRMTHWRGPGPVCYGYSARAQCPSITLDVGVLFDIFHSGVFVFRWGERV